MQDPKIAKNYAVSLFDNVVKKEQETVFEQLTLLTDAMQADDKLFYALCSPVVNNSSKITLLEAIAKKCKFKPVILQFYKILVRNGRFSSLKEITENYKKLLDESSGVKEVEICSAKKLGASELKFIKGFLEKNLDAKIEIKHQEDKELLGGAVIKFDSKLLDCSLKGALEKIEKAAKNVKVM